MAANRTIAISKVLENEVQERSQAGKDAWDRNQRYRPLALECKFLKTDGLCKCLLGPLDLLLCYGIVDRQKPNDFTLAFANLTEGIEHLLIGFLAHGCFSPSSVAVERPRLSAVRSNCWQGGM